jgi:hypothetical protein
LTPSIWPVVRALVAGSILVGLSGCSGLAMPESVVPSPPDAVDPERVSMMVSCGGRPFPAEVLTADGDAELDDHPATAALRTLLADPNADDLLPQTGWRLAVAERDGAVFIADLPGGDVPFAEVSVRQEEGVWRVAGYGHCRPTADVGPGLGLAEFRVAPGMELRPEITELDVLVTERACNSGEDASGRIVEPAIIVDATTVTVVFGVAPRSGNHTCPSNPETPFILRLPEPLGDRHLLDGAPVPPRDATTCPDIAVCPGG